MGTFIRRKARKKPWMSTKPSTKQKKKRQQVASASERDHRYKGGMWLATRQHVLHDYPTCGYCPYLGQLKPSTHVDHIVKASEYGGDFYDRTNLVGCCASCHAKKTSYETKGARFNTLEQWGEYFTSKWRNQVKGY